MILDCTLRDGGYYNQWDFDFDLVKKYIQVVYNSGIDAVEVGYRSLNYDNYYGSCYYCTEDFINSLGIPDDLLVSVMINASEIVHHYECGQDLIDSLFLEKYQSRIDIVRIAVDLKDINKIFPAVNNLKRKGYKVCINLMKITLISDEDLLLSLELLASNCHVDVFYIADSFGNLSETNMLEKLKLVKTMQNLDVGVHLHNNQGKACSNALCAYKNGVEWIDATIMGMGRGAGNTSTERFMLDFNEINKSSKYKPEKLFGIILNEFSGLKEKYQWGYNLLYEISSRYSLHPTHIQELIAERDRYTPDQILSSVYRLIDDQAGVNLSNLGGKDISEVNKNIKHFQSFNCPINSPILFLGSGSEGLKHSSELERFIRKKKPFIISLNTTQYVDYNLVDIFVFLNEFRMVAELSNIENHKGKILIPANRIPAGAYAKIDLNRILNFPVSIEKGKFDCNVDRAVVPYEIVFAYAVSAILSSDPSVIYLYGLDGYVDTNIKQRHMLEIFKLIQNVNISKIPLVSLTKTTYPVVKRSIYDPKI